MLNNLAEILIPVVGDLNISTYDRTEEHGVVILDLPGTPYMAYGSHPDIQNAIIEFSVFADHETSKQTIQDILSLVQRSYHETNEYTFQFSYPDSTPQNREVELNET